MPPSHSITSSARRRIEDGTSRPSALAADRAELVLSTIQDHLEHWRARGNVGDMAQVKRFDAVIVIRRAMANCADEYPPSATTELLLVNDAALRENILRDLGATERALNNAEWKAATVLEEPQSRLSCIGGYRSVARCRRCSSCCRAPGRQQNDKTAPQRHRSVGVASIHRGCRTPRSRNRTHVAQLDWRRTPET